MRGYHSNSVGSGDLDAVAGFAFLVEVAAVDVVDDRDGEVLDLEAAEGLGAELFVGQDLRLLDAAGDDGAGAQPLPGGCYRFVLARAVLRPQVDLQVGVKRISHLADGGERGQ